MRRGFLKLGKGASSVRVPEDDQSQINDIRDIIIYSIDPCPNEGPFVYKARVVPASFDRSGPVNSPRSDKSLCTRIPPSPIDSYGSCESFVASRTMRRLLETPGYPCSPPEIPASKVYKLSQASESSLGRGMFALKPLKVGDLILVERPMLLACNVPIVKGNNKWLDPSGNPNWRGSKEFLESAGVFNAILEVMFSRLSKVDQEAYLALPNAHKDGPALVGIWRTNNALFNNLALKGEDFTYSAMFREQSWINHNCKPNCNFSFDPASFSTQLRATRPISPGEEIVLSICAPTLSTSERSVWLSDMGFTCTCPSCVYNPSIPRNDGIRSSIPNRLKLLETLRLSAPTPSSDLVVETLSASVMTSDLSQKLQKNHVVALKVIEKARELMHDMKAEGLEGASCYFKAMETRCLATMEASFTSRYDAALSRSSLRSQWDSEVKDLATKAVVLYKSHYGSFKKHQFENLLGPFGMLNL